MKFYHAWDDMLKVHYGLDLPKGAIGFKNSAWDPDRAQDQRPFWFLRKDGGVRSTSAADVKMETQAGSARENNNEKKAMVGLEDFTTR